MRTLMTTSRTALGGLGLLLGLGLGTASAEAQTLIDDCPFTITEPGSYRLAGDLECDGEGIIIEADNVRLNLGSGTLTGPDDGDSDGVRARLAPRTIRSPA